MKDKITILTTTHYVASTSKRSNYHGNHDRSVTHTGLIRSVMADLYRKIGDEDIHHIISLDHDETNQGSIDYLDNLHDLAEEFPNLEIIHTTKGIYHSIKNLAEACPTPYYLWFEHDWSFVNRMDLSKFIEVMDNDTNVNYIRFNKRQTRHMGCDGLLWDYENPYMSLTGTNGWSNNPYFGRKSKMIEWYEMMEESGQIGGSDDKFDPTIEVYLQKRSREALNESMEKWLKDWGVFIYGKQGDPATVQHLNGKDK